MKKPSQHILHITPHFAPGKCGVSDYVLSWNASMGSDVPLFIVALADKYYPGIYRDAGLLRIGAEQPIANRFLLFEFLEQNSFNALVIHYVPHGYQANGLPWWMLRIASGLHKQGVSITLVAHELWVGGPGKPFRVRVKGYLQKLLFLRLARLLNHPPIITTSGFTARELNREGIVADWCPVFSNLGVQVSAGAIPGNVRGLLKIETYTTVLMFGSMPPDAAGNDIRGFFEMLWRQYLKPILLVHAGHADMLPLRGIETACAGIDVRVETIGPLPAGVLNALMQQCHWGMSTYPLQLWSKSGSIAAMLANALPVAVLGSLQHEILPQPESLPKGLLAWKLLSGPERETFMRQNIKVNPCLADYNRLIAIRLNALSGLGVPEITTLDIKPSLTVVITVFRCWPQAMECIRHLMACSGIDGDTEILLINDDPESLVPEAILQARGVTVIHNPINIGYVASVNKGVAMAKGEAILLLDADAFIKTSIKSALILMASDPGAKLLVPVCEMANGTLVRRLYPQPHIVSMLFGQLVEKWWMKINRPPQYISHSYAWFFNRNDFLAIGGFDERLRFLEADVEFCMRLNQAYPAGIRMCGSVRVIHEGGANPIRRNQRVAEWYKSRWYILTKHHAIPFRAVFKGMIATRLLIERGLASLFSFTQPAKGDFWRQKSEGRKMLLGDLKNW